MGSSNYVLKTFHLSGAMVESFQRRVNYSCSSFELAAAHLWKCTRAHDNNGNAFVLASVALTAGELEELSHEAIVEKIKEAKNSINNEFVNAYIEALDGSQGSLPSLKELTIVSDWTRMPFHKIDFLNGEAAYAYPLASPIPQVAYFMQNPSDLRDIDVRIGPFVQTLDAFSH